MGNKDKHKKKKKPISSPTLTSRSRSKSKGSDRLKGDAYDLIDKQDDYGFLGSRKCRPTKRNEDCYNGKRSSSEIRRRHLEVAEQYSCTNGYTKANYHQPHHSYNKQTYQKDDSDAICSKLGFYPQVVERQSRSTSRPSRIPKATMRDKSDTNTIPDRSRSKSRDIVALYTSQTLPRSRSATPAGSLHSYLYTPTPSMNEQLTTRSRSCTPARSLPSYKFHPLSSTPCYSNTASRSATPTTMYNRRSRSVVSSVYDRSSTLMTNSTRTSSRRARSETRYSRDCISLSSNLSTQSRALSNSEIASQNLELWMSTTSKTQRPSSKIRKQEDKKNAFVTLLEMDPQVNEATEQLLNNSTSVSPANVKMMMIAGHVPSENWESKDEIMVKSGALITGLYKQNEWLFISREDGSSGYVPYAYTKAIKITSLAKANISAQPGRLSSHSTKVNPQMPSNAGILKKSKVESHETRKVYNKYSLRNDEALQSSYRRSKERDSLSSTNSVFLDELLCARPSALPRTLFQQNMFADCMVVDADNKFYGVMNDDLRAYCSDSGISEPNSNHSDELDRKVTSSNANRRSQEPNIVMRDSISSIESSFLNSSNDNYSGGNLQQSLGSGMIDPTMKTGNGEAQHMFHSKNISFMPLGPLGERLQLANTATTTVRRSANDYEPPVYSNISEQMMLRAQQTSQQLPTELKPEIPKDYNGPRVRVIYDYTGDIEDDVHVRAGEVVTLLNGEDVEWIWVMRRDGMEGFMPREYVLPLEVYRPKPKPTRGNQQHNLVVAL